MNLSMLDGGCIVGWIVLCLSCGRNRVARWAED